MEIYFSQHRPTLEHTIHHRIQFKTSPETPWTAQHYGIAGFKGIDTAVVYFRSPALEHTIHNIIQFRTPPKTPRTTQHSLTAAVYFRSPALEHTIHHTIRFRTSPETPRTSHHYGIEGFHSRCIFSQSNARAHFPPPSSRHKTQASVAPTLVRHVPPSHFPFPTRCFQHSFKLALAILENWHISRVLIQVHYT